jgi:hypothetical protein
VQDPDYARGVDRWDHQHCICGRLG